MAKSNTTASFGSLLCVSKAIGRRDIKHAANTQISRLTWRLHSACQPEATRQQLHAAPRAAAAARPACRAAGAGPRRASKQRRRRHHRRAVTLLLLLLPAGCQQRREAASLPTAAAAGSSRPQRGWSTEAASMLTQRVPCDRTGRALCASHAAQALGARGSDTIQDTTRACVCWRCCPLRPLWLRRCCCCCCVGELLRLLLEVVAWRLLEALHS